MEGDRTVPGIFGSIRQGAAPAAFEADKLRRVNQVQSEITALKRQVNQHTTQLSDRAIELYKTGELTQVDLVAECEQIASQRDQITLKQTRVEEIQQETMKEEGAPSEGVTCPVCGTPIPDGASFCPACGAAAGAPEPEEALCTNCQASISADTVFCLRCGTRVQQ
jgi:rubrerythrin